MRDRTVIGPWIRRFLLEHLVSDRNLTRNTQASYRDTLLLLLPFVSQAQKKPTDRLMIDDLSQSRLRSFLEYLEKERGCSGATRNLRLAAIHSLAKFIGMRSPEHVAWSTEIRAVPFKKTPKSSLTYLDKPEIDALLKAPDLRTPQGSRDYALLLFLYNTGARVEEAAQLTIDTITWSSSPAVRLVGKGNKTRSCPIWKRTADMLKPLVAGRNTREFVFLNRRDEPRRASAFIALFAAPPIKPLGRCRQSRQSALARTVFAIRAPSICFAPAWTSIPSGRGLGMFPWTPRTFTRRSTWK